jgi:RNA polymerase sigma factor for flagellar operon FliA
VGQDAHWLGSLSEKLAVVYFTTIGEPRAQESSLMLADTSEPAPSEQVATAELSQKIHAMVDSLPTQAADLVRSTYFEGLTLQEAGKRLGISKSWASRVHAKALQQLARSLKLVGITD